MVKLTPSRRPGAVRRHQYKRAETPPKPSGEPVETIYTVGRHGEVTIKLDADRDAILCEGGPWHGWSYYLDEMLTKQRLWTETRILWAKANGAADYEAFPYVQMRRKKLHPGTGGLESQVWAYRPSRAEVPT